MQIRPLGKTGLEVSIVGFGCAPLGNQYGDVAAEEGERALQYALDQGVNFVDVAPYYGVTLAETRLGKALKGRRDEVVLATKCCRYDKQGFDFSAARVMADIDSSLKRLQTDRIDLFQVHDVEFGRREQILEETLPAMRAVQAAGKARFIGITGLPVEMLAGLASEFEVDTVLSYCHCNLLDDRLDAVLRPLAVEQGIGLINASPLHMGILSSHGPQSWHPAPPEVIAMGDQLRALCKSAGRDIVDVALRHVFDYEGVASTLMGARTQAEVEQNLGVLEQTSDPQLLARIAEMVAPVRNHWWHEGLPQNSPSAI